jgi:peptidoglycan/LPS O-acetylase OafA/YrhL
LSTIGLISSGQELAAAATPRAASRPRWATFDLARLIAAYGVVWLHAGRLPSLEASTAAGRFAVPFFVFATVFFVFDGLRRRPWLGFGQYAWSRLVRIYLPFLAWSGIYLALKLAKAAVLPEQENVFPGWSVLWTGSFYHLWFLPFILVVSLAAFALGKAVLGCPAADGALVVACLAAGLLWALMPAPASGPLASGRGLLVASAVPSACWAVALALLYRGAVADYLKQPAALLAAALLLVGATAWVWQCHSSKLAPTLAGLGFMLLALGPSVGGWAARLSTFGPLAYGIYLSHLLFIKVFESLLAKLGRPVSWQTDAAVFAATCLLSTLLAWALSRHGATRWLVA